MRGALDRSTLAAGAVNAASRIFAVLTTGEKMADARIMCAVSAAQIIDIMERAVRGGKPPQSMNKSE